MKKCKGGCQMRSGGKTCIKCGCDMEDEEYEKGEKEMRSGGMACMKCGGKMHKSGGTVSSCMKCGGGKYTFGGKVGWSKKKINNQYASGGMIKRADGSYSQRGLWDNIRANAGSGKKPTKQMLEQEKKIKQEMAVGGKIPNPVDPIYVTNPSDPRLQNYSDSLLLHNASMRDKKAFFNPSMNTAEKWQDYINKNSDTPAEVEAYNRLTRLNRVKPTYEYQEERYLPFTNPIFANLQPTNSKVNIYKKPVQPVIYKPEVRVPVTEYTQQDLDNAFKQRREQEDLEAWNKWIAENPLPEPEPQMNDEMEITYFKPVDMPMIKPGLIPTSEIVPNMNTGIKYQKESGQGSYPTMSGEEQGMTNKKSKKKSFSFGGAITGFKKYQYGGEIDNTNITNDAQIPLSKGSYEVPEPEFDANAMSDVDPIEVSNNAMKGTAAQDYKKIVATNTAFKVNKSLPNWGYAKREQMKLNELIRKDISAGNAKMDLLVEDDIIGDKTLGAMRAYEASGQYVRPEGFKDKWLAEYKKQWDEMQATGKSKTNVPKDNNIVEQPKKTESKTMLDDFYSYFNKSSKDIKDKPVGYGTVLRPEESKPKVKSMAAKYSAEKYQQKQQSAGWPRTALLQEGGIEVSTSNLKRKDFDTYFPISGASSSSSKGVRATGRDNNKSYFDAVEKAQTLRKDMSLGNTSLQLIDKLLSSSKKAIVIPKGQDKYGRELKDIYLQDPFNQERYHALDSIGVVEGEAIFGMDINPKPGSLTKRQEKITKQAQEKGGFKYYNSPSSFRKYSK